MTRDRRTLAVAAAAMGLALSAVLAAVGAVGASPAPVVSVVMVSIDGLRPDYVLEADRLGLRIPNLRRMLREGAHATGVAGVLPTVTYPSHTTLLTGVAPRRHNILANTPFDPMGRNLDGWYWYAEDIKAGRGFGDYEAAPGQTERYPIAGYYRSRQSRRGFGYSPFWNSGYGGSRRRLPLVVGFRRSIGENGDLFLFAPTFLAPVGPLTGAFLGGW